MLTVQSKVEGLSELYQCAPRLFLLMEGTGEGTQEENQRYTVLKVRQPPGPKSDGNPDSRIPEYIPGYIHISGSENLKIKV